MFKHVFFRKTGYAVIIGFMAFTLSHGQINWTVRYSIPDLYNLQSVAWTGTQFVAVGGVDTIFTSSDGATWSLQQVTGAKSLNSVIWADSQLIAVGDSGRILTSPDGITWTRQTSATTNSLNAVTWTGTQYVAVGGSTVVTSPDGVLWTKQPLTGTSILRSVAWTGSLLVAVGATSSGDATILSSPDGITWTSRLAGEINELYSVSWSGGQLVATGEWCLIYTSPDGITWTRRVLGPLGRLYSTVWTGSMYIVVGSDGYRYTSTDGVTWTPSPVTSRTVGMTFFSMAWTGSQFVAVGNRGSVYTSSNGSTWVNRRLMIEPGAFRSVAWNGSQFAAFGDSAFTSSNGVAWTHRSTGIDTFYTYKGGLIFVTWTGDRFLAATIRSPDGVAYQYGYIHTSTDGMAWTAKDWRTSWFCTSIATTSNQLIAVGYHPFLFDDSCIVLSSTNGDSWTIRNTGLGWCSTSTSFSTLLYGATWTGSKIVAVGIADNYYTNRNSATILTSPDGITWSNSRLAFSRQLNSVIWADSQLVTVGDSGRIITSPDGVSWTSRTSGVTNNLKSVIWAGGQLVAVGTGGIILTSPDGVTWTPQISGTAKTLYSVTCSSDMVVAAGDMYTIVTSPNVTNIPHPPATPVLASPANGATAQPVSLTLVWNIVSSATSYYVQVANDSGFASIFMEDSALTYSRRAVSGLAYTTTYYWRVRAKNVYGISAWSGYRSFTTAMSPPTLVSPVDAASDQPVSLTLVWNKVSSATTYHVQVATDTGFIAVFLRDSTYSDSQRMVSGLSNGTVYYWRVRAKNAGGVSAWSVYRRFFTVGALPSAVVIITPADSAIISVDSVRLVWNIAAPAVDRYQVEVATDSAMTNFMTQDSSVTDTTRLMTSLVNNTTYYWRVKAHNAAGWGSYSAEKRFVTSFTGVLFGGNAIRVFSLKYKAGSLLYTLPKQCFVSVKYYDIRGRMVASYVGRMQGAGSYTLRLPSWGTGAYVQVFTAGEIIRKDKIMLMR